MIIDVTNKMNPVPLMEGYIDINNRNRLKIPFVSGVCVHSIEGDNIPHFHIERDGRKDVCVRLDINEFFNHGAKDETLNAKDSRTLCEWLNKPNLKYRTPEGIPYYNNWKVLADMWNSHGTTKVDFGKMPDYSIIYPYKYFENKNKGVRFHE